MASDIDVNEQELQKFIEVLAQFQEQIDSKMKSVEGSWLRCHESWKGATATQFAKDYEKTANAVTAAVKTGDDSLDWLRRFHTIVREFENY